jgi:hypothetical protein
MDSAEEKLRRGVVRLETAGDDRGLLGQALLMIHGALEDSFRDRLARNTALDPQLRAQVREVQHVQWKQLLDLMTMHGGLSPSDKRTIQRMNSLRQGFAHGGEYTGTRHELVAYAELVQRLTQFRPATRSAPPPIPFVPPTTPASASPARARPRRGRTFVRVLAVLALLFAAAVLFVGTTRPSDMEGVEHWTASALLVLDGVRAGGEWLLRGAPGGLAGLGQVPERPTVSHLTPGAEVLVEPTIVTPPTVATERPAGLVVGARAQVVGTGSAPLRVRDEPSTAGQVVARFAEGTELELVDGPRDGDGRVWWRVRSGNAEGWCAAEFLAPVE